MGHLVRIKLHGQLGRLRNSVNSMHFLSFYFLLYLIVLLIRDSKIPEPPAGHKWKMVKHDNTVTWLVTWTENIQGQTKYIMLNPNSRIKVKNYLKKVSFAKFLAQKSPV